uniref:Biopolymer transport protein ExbD/TolR n=1 Tax=mine drainage metagenome TaxID=410659 RepID=E6QAD3_9ZZZZ
MERRYFEQRKGQVEIIPMIDIMLFLLVFLIMITIQMIPDKRLNLQLPASSQSGETAAAPALHHQHRERWDGGGQGAPL